MAKIMAVLTFWGGLAALATMDVSKVTEAVSFISTGNIMGAVNDLAVALGATAGFFHLHLKFSIFGVNVDSGNNS